jgi:uncharacterized integral membrane protein
MCLERVFGSREDHNRGIVAILFGAILFPLILFFILNPQSSDQPYFIEYPVCIMLLLLLIWGIIEVTVGCIKMRRDVEV